MTYKYLARQSSATLANVFFLIGVTASQYLSFVDSSEKNTAGLKLNSSESSYIHDGISSTTSPETYSSGSLYVAKHDRGFIEAVSTFYATLSSRQKPLGKEFEQVLNENLSDLYGS
ncbi:MAG: hypothetical protein OXF20_12030 [Gammaproteobacteria bacterium]|nr:hypothetical protein [Gammaproteobacteria bacterium]